MSNLNIRISNDIEILFTELAGKIRQSPLPPLQEEMIIVQSLGMRRWATLKLAKALGCAAGISLPFPGSFCHNLVGCIDNKNFHDEKNSSFSRNILKWRILRHLDSIDSEHIKAYLKNSDTLMKYQLADKISNTFDDYQLYRPELLKIWEKGDISPDNLPHEMWQMKLWKLLCDESEESDLSKKFRLLIDVLEAGEGDFSLPERISVFGINSIAPIFLELLKSLSKRCEVTIYVVSPSISAANENPLIESLCEQSKDFFSLLKSKTDLPENWSEANFNIPQRDNLLHSIQNDIMCGKNPAFSDFEQYKYNCNDKSIVINSCHSIRREMEVLKDQLVNTFETFSDLKPFEVLVMVPDMEEYLPFIDAVFGIKKDGYPHIPYRVADRKLSSQISLAESFMRLVSLVEGRMTSREILDFLSTETVRLSAGIEEEDIPLITEWIKEANIRWGIDGKFKEDNFSLPDDDSNTWQTGLDRLIMGYATAEEEIFDSMLPLNMFDSSSGKVLGKFVYFCNKIFSTVKEFKRKHTLSEWQNIFQNALDSLFRDENNTSHEFEIVYNALGDLGIAESASGLKEKIDIKTIKAHLTSIFADDGFGTDFISGNITFCAMKPMRTIPFRVIAVCGMNNSCFPRNDMRVAFDVQQYKTLQGDRNIRKDDRQLFLENVLAAKDKLIFSYIGQSQKDNSEQAASVCLLELLEYIDDASVIEKHDNNKGKVTENIFTSHRLQPFSKVYYQSANKNFFTYNKDYFKDSTEELNENFQSNIIKEIITIEEINQIESSVAVNLYELKKFWQNPSKYFLQNRLGLRIPDKHSLPEEDEYFFLDGLNRYKLGQDAINNYLNGVDLTGSIAQMKLTGQMPPAYSGEASSCVLSSEVKQFVQNFEEEERLPDISFSKRVGAHSVSGKIKNIFDFGSVVCIFSKLKPKHLMDAWIDYLALCLCEDIFDQNDFELRIFTADSKIKFAGLSTSEAKKHLTELIKIYSFGAQKYVPFFNNSSFEKSVKGKSLNSTSIPWAGNSFGNFNTPGDIDDEYIYALWRDENPFEMIPEIFEHIANVFWKPCAAQMEEF
jgi:exodeoxyribonuclease V gamma subunit